MNNGEFFWHGGPSGIAGYILPSEITGASCTADFGAEGVCRRDRVYLTSNRIVAEMFACMAAADRVSVYLVLPVGDVEHDPDTGAPGLSFQAPKARIIQEFRMSTSRRLRMQEATIRA